MKLSNFKRYTPVTPPFGGAAYSICDEGVDFYDSQKMFKEDTIKVIYFESSGAVIYSVKDITSVFPPDGTSIVEVGSVPEIDAFTRFDGSRFFVDATAKRNADMNAKEEEANKIIKVLSDERDAGIISDDDLSRWKAWVAYRKELRELDVTADDIKWPDKPE